MKDPLIVLSEVELPLMVRGPFDDKTVLPSERFVRGKTLKRMASFSKVQFPRPTEGLQVVY